MMKFNNTGSVLIMALSAATMCSVPVISSITCSDMPYPYGIVSQYDDIDGEISISSQIYGSDCWSTIKPALVVSDHRSEKVTLKITKVSKYTPSYDFEEEYDEI